VDVPPASSTTPVRKPDGRTVAPPRCPGTLITNRRLPGAVPVWSGCATILGLHNAAPSIAYSLVNTAPSNKHSRLRKITGGIKTVGDFMGVPTETCRPDPDCRPSKRVTTSSNDARTSSSSSAMMRASTAPERGVLKLETPPARARTAA